MTSFEKTSASSHQHDEDDLSWLIQYLPINESDRAKVQLQFADFSESGGLSGASMRKVVMTWKNDSSIPEKRFVYKNIVRTGMESSARLGLAREAIFYKQFGNKLINDLDITIPYPYYSYGDMSTGEKVLLLEDLSDCGVLSSFYFGPTSPVNWGKDLDALVAKFPGPKPTLITLISDVFEQVARMHRQYWHDESLLGNSWLRSADWIQGKNQASWEVSQNLAKDQWKIVKEKIAHKQTSFEWNSDLVAVVDASLAKTSWENYQQLLTTRSWTLVHGDFHPGNCFWIAHDSVHDNALDHSLSGKTKSGKTVLLDWEMVGLGNGPQELSQYMISHVAPAMRRELEEQVLQLYYRTLTSSESTGGKIVRSSEYSYEKFYSEYVYGGFERWVWFLAYLPAFCPEPMIQYWHNQMVAFMQDHQITVQTIGIPRV